MKYLKGNSTRLMIALGILGLIAAAILFVYARSISIKPEVRETLGWLITTIFSLSGFVKGLIARNTFGNKGEAAAQSGKPAWTFTSPRGSGGDFYRPPSLADPFSAMGKKPPDRKGPIPETGNPEAGIGWYELFRLSLLALAASFALVGAQTVFLERISPQTLLLILGVVAAGFGVMGARVGWAGGMMVTLALTTAISSTSLLREFWPGDQDPRLSFIIQSLLVFLLLFMGFSTLKVLPARTIRPVLLMDRLLGGVLGMMNGYLAAGTLLFLMIQNGFGHGWTGADPSGLSIEQLAAYLPPAVLVGPSQFVFLTLIMIFVILIFV